MTVGQLPYRYEAVPGWGRSDERPVFGGVICGIAAGDGDRVFMCRRDPPALLVYDSGGRYVDAWGEKTLSSPHSVYAGPHGLWVADTGDHTIRRFSYSGRVEQVLGAPGGPGVPGEPGRPFNKPTKAVTGPDGKIYVSDGYGQYRVHCFSAAGDLLVSWGAQGTDDGAFALPHSVAIERDGGVIVVDRENSRLQFFTPGGDFRSAFNSRQWPGLLWPNDVAVGGDDTLYLAEAAHRVSIWRRTGEPDPSPVKAPAGELELLARWGEFGTGQGQFLDCPHAITVDRRGDLYVCEVPFHADRVHKFRRVDS